MTNKLNTNLGFLKNPFSKFSAEEELEFNNEIFYEPTFYQTLLDDLKSGTSRFILGQRGHGKSSIIHKLKEDLEHSQILTIIIDRFDEISLTNNKVELLNLILQEFVTKYVIFLSKNRTYLQKLNNQDKEELSLLIKLFFKPLTTTEYENRYNDIKKIKNKNSLINIYNKLVKPANSLIGTGILITSKLIADSFKLTNFETCSNTYTEYISEISKVNTSANEQETELKHNKRHLKELLNRLNKISKKTYYKSSVVLFDKVDEFQELNQDINKIANFTEDILTDTELLLQNDIAIAFSLWSEVKPILSKKVRFDKFKEIDISWKKSNMEPLIDKRILHFTGNTRGFDSLFENRLDIQNIIEISNKSPRDLISCLSDIYDYQTSNEYSQVFETKNVSKGLIKFATRYDYLSIYPSKTGRNKDVISMINMILRTRKVDVTVRDLNLTFNRKTKWSLSNLENMVRYKLVEEDSKLGINGEKLYKVLDPKLIHLIKRGVTNLQNN
ncbi:P-loop ATPase, Sll1717 family [Aquimarina agarilytica]|uniref:P-loop ATPase, Sll1717 family n=1 Tax=Aquimarina agarilytica TaxID=1087449 RepID=UPI00028A4077|nr:ATP-binding protein [Aquimarina agarilytica]